MAQSTERPASGDLPADRAFLTTSQALVKKIQALEDGERE